MMRSDKSLHHSSAIPGVMRSGKSLCRSSAISGIMRFGKSLHCSSAIPGILVPLETVIDNRLAGLLRRAFAFRASSSRRVFSASHSRTGGFPRNFIVLCFGVLVLALLLVWLWPACLREHARPSVANVAADAAAHTALPIASADQGESSRTVTQPGRYTTFAVASAKTKVCLECHVQLSGNLVAAWERSKHARHQVGCYECHQTAADDADAFDHYGVHVSPLVTPRDCGRCHARQAEEFAHSRHALTGEVVRAGKDCGAEFAAAGSAEQFGCGSCHGVHIQVASADAQIRLTGYPNSGIGRINPDGSVGNCAACHQRHDFRRDTVRKAETCGRCHRGLVHPHLEIWQESRHGLAFAESNAHIDLNAPSLLPSRALLVTPTCVTCHLGAATADDPGVIHDPAARLSWNLRGELSQHTHDWPEKRGNMQSVCRNCHSNSMIQGHYAQFDQAVARFNDKYVRPAQEILRRLRVAGKLDHQQPAADQESGELPSQAYNSEFPSAPRPHTELEPEPGQRLLPQHRPQRIEYIYRRLWQQHGRCAQHAAAMMGANHLVWHGFNEAYSVFFTELVPEAEKLLPGVTADLPGVTADLPDSTADVPAPDAW